MKKFIFSSCVAVALSMVLFSCDNDKNGVTPSTTPSLEQSYISVENGVYHADEMPAATSSESVEGVSLSDQVMNGAINFITINTDQTFTKFFLGITGVEGYIEYVPTTDVRSRAENSYVIPLMIAQDYSGDCELVLSGELENGAVTIPGHFQLKQIETREGDLEVKLAFSNEKDVDLHLFTPSGIHIYFGNSYDGYYWGEIYDEEGNPIYSDDGEGFEFGLDIDSNAGCTIDGINKENIYIPTQFLENGTYRVEVDLYSNCDPSIPTSWSITTRLNGNLITPETGSNPAYGEFEEGAPSSYNDNRIEVMTFTISGVRSTGTRGIDRVKISPEHRPSQAQLDKIDFYRARLED